MIYIVKINDKEYEVEVEKGVASIIKTTAVQSIPPALAPVSAAMETQTTQATAKTSHGTAAKPNQETVSAPMPGTIMEIKVNQGVEVKKGDSLVLLEAMKMENEIVAPLDGVIVQICVAKGASVSTGDPLVVIG